MNTGFPGKRSILNPFLLNNEITINDFEKKEWVYESLKMNKQINFLHSHKWILNSKLNSLK